MLLCSRYNLAPPTSRCWRHRRQGTAATRLQPHRTSLRCSLAGWLAGCTHQHLPIRRRAPRRPPAPSACACALSSSPVTHRSPSPQSSDLSGSGRSGGIGEALGVARRYDREYTARAPGAWWVPATGARGCIIATWRRGGGGKGGRSRGSVSGRRVGAGGQGRARSSERRRRAGERVDEGGGDEARRGRCELPSSTLLAWRERATSLLMHSRTLLVTAVQSILCRRWEQRSGAWCQRAPKKTAQGRSIHQRAKSRIRILKGQREKRQSGRR